MKTYSETKHWKKSVRRRALWSLKNSLCWLAASLIVIILIITVLLNVFFPNDAESLCLLNFRVSRAAKDYLSAIAAVVGILFSLGVANVRCWCKSFRQLYHPAAISIIANLERKEKISKALGKKLMDQAETSLGPLREKECPSEPSELLDDAAEKMAKLIECS